MILLLDNFDSFTYNLVDYLAQCGHSCKVIRNDTSPEEISRMSFDAIVLSPGPETPEKAGVMNQLIAKYYCQLPILGICLGHQALGQFFGAKLEKAIKPMHGKISRISIDNHDDMFLNLPDRVEVTRYHSLVLKSIPAHLKVIGTTDEGEVMAIKHRQYPVRGIQFHPEAVLTQEGLRMLKNWTTAFCK